MADISRLPWLRHLRGAPTTYVVHLRGGKVVHEGTGQSFWFRPLSAVLSEVPVDDREIPLMFHARTSDFQDVVVQGTLTFRITDPSGTSSRVDFSIDPDTGSWRGRPLEQLHGMLAESAQQSALDLLARTTLASALVEGVVALRDRISAGLASDARLAETGLAVIGIRVVAVTPEPDVEKALKTPVREQVQQEADKATFERRAVAVERERAIGENELQTRIELAKREEQLIMQNGANARKAAQEDAAASQIRTETEAAREERLSLVKANATRSMGEARGAAEVAWLSSYRNIDEGKLLGLALRDLAINLPKVQSLVLSPDLLSPVLARLGKDGLGETGGLLPGAAPPSGTPAQVGPASPPSGPGTPASGQTGQKGRAEPGRGGAARPPGK